MKIVVVVVFVVVVVIQNQDTKVIFTAVFLKSSCHKISLKTFTSFRCVFEVTNIIR